MLQLPGHLKCAGKNEKYLLKKSSPGITRGDSSSGRSRVWQYLSRSGPGAESRPHPPYPAAGEGSAGGFFAPDYVQELLDRWGRMRPGTRNLVWNPALPGTVVRIYLDQDLEPDTPLSEVV